jgi:hypothetical protein
MCTCRDGARRAGLRLADTPASIRLVGSWCMGLAVVKKTSDAAAAAGSRNSSPTSGPAKVNVVGPCKQTARQPHKQPQGEPYHSKTTP